MALDLLDLYRRASAWTNEKVVGAAEHLDAPTPCDQWDVRALLNHMLDTQRYFIGAARGEKAQLPSPTPPDVLSDDPVGDFERTRVDALRAFGEPGVVEKMGPSLGIALSDQLLHGWDLAQATGQDPTMPDDLAQAAYEMIHGRLTEEQRQGVFKDEIPTAADASPQERLLAYAGRRPG